MSWLFSQALVAAYSQATCSDGVACAQLSVMPTAHKFWRRDKPMDACRLSQFGLTCAVLTADRGAELLTWYLAGFRAKTLALPVEVRESTGSAAGYGGKWRESSVRYCRDTCSWRTHRTLFDSVLPASSATLPAWGTTRNGVVYQHPTLARPINATVSGLLPTPTASQHKGWSKGHKRAMTDDRLDYTIERQAYEQSTPGRLNPTFVEWLMGWPIGWTNLSHLAMGKFQEWQQQHSVY